MCVYIQYYPFFFLVSTWLLNSYLDILTVNTISSSFFLEILLAEGGVYLITLFVYEVTLLYLFGDFWITEDGD